jgi:hypothetical protein
VIVENFVFRFAGHVSSITSRVSQFACAAIFKNGTARVALGSGCPRRSGTCFAHPDQEGGRLIPFSRDFYFVRKFGK